MPVHTTSTTLFEATLTRLFGAGSSIVSNKSSLFVTLIVAPLSEMNDVNACFLCFAVRPRAMLNATGFDGLGLVASITSVGFAGRRLRTTDEE